MPRTARSAVPVLPGLGAYLIVQRYTSGRPLGHVAIDDATRLAYAEVLPDEKATTAIGFLRRAIAFYERHGITRMKNLLGSYT